MLGFMFLIALIKLLIKILVKEINLTFTEKTCFVNPARKVTVSGIFQPFSLENRCKETQLRLPCIKIVNFFDE